MKTVSVLRYVVRLLADAAAPEIGFGVTVECFGGCDGTVAGDAAAKLVERDTADDAPLAAGCGDRPATPRSPSGLLGVAD